jgi:hypothetical protein
MDRANFSDDDVLRRAAAGDERSFAALYPRYSGRVYRCALPMLGSPSLAEEVSHEVSLVLMRETAGLEPAKGSLSLSWRDQPQVRSAVPGSGARLGADANERRRAGRRSGRPRTA